MIRNDERMLQCNLYLTETQFKFPLALGESRTRDQQETNWYVAIEVRACPWTIKNMHKAPAKLKLKFLFKKLVCNVGVVKQLR